MEEKTWGVRFNEYSDYQRLRKGQKPLGCLDWFETHQINTWQEQGLVVWNSIDKKIVALNGNESLKLLSELNTHDHWKSQGVSIARLVHIIEFEVPLRGRSKKTKQEPTVETKKSEPVYEEILHLPPEAGPELIELLEAKKHVISGMADREKKQFNEAMRQFWDWVLKHSREKEQSEIDFNARPFEWQSLYPLKWNCRYQSAEGRVWLGENRFFWQACVRRPGLVGKSDHFIKLLKAVEWVEKEIVELANQPPAPEPEPHFRSDEQIAEDRIRLKRKLISGPYWIEPTVLEPKRITYKLFIELEVKPTSFKTFESIDGDTFYYDKHYPSPTKLMSDLNLDADHFNIDQPIGENSEWYQITSLTTYYQEESAAEQSQKAWDQSNIVKQFKAGKISRARYGYREVEIGFESYLGACEEPDKPWEQAPTRNEHMQLLAFQESLSFALDVTDYRDYLGVSPKFIKDEQILEIMHRTRARSKYLPEEIRRESKIWLAEHAPLDSAD